jgi:hypothetical protein
MIKITNEFKNLVRTIYAENNNNLTITVKLVQEIRPQTHASSVKFWVDPEYAKIKNEQNKKADQKWKNNNPDSYKKMVQKRTDKVMECYYTNEEYKQQHLESTRNWHKTNPEKVRNYRESTREKRKQRRREYEKKKLEENFEYRVMHNMRCFLRNKLKRHFKRGGAPYKKALTTSALVGCNAEELANHLRKLYKPGMTDDNHGDWHIDHIIPCAAFDLTDTEQAKKCFHFTNLQPLWAHENLSKSDKY